MGKFLTQDEAVKRYSSNNSKLIGNYKESRIPVEFLCECGQKFFRRVYDIHKSPTCQKCSGRCPKNMDPLTKIKENSKINCNTKIINGSHCIEWTGAIHKNGYGRSRFNSKYQSVHRVIYQIHNNIILTDPKLFVCHDCDNPKCCNPNHLFLGDANKNKQDQVNKGRFVGNKHWTILKPENNSYGSKSHFSKLTESDIPNIFKLHKEGLKNYEIANMYNISNMIISLVLRRKIWKHVKIEGQEN